jgi:hypothetical protein
MIGVPDFLCQAGQIKRGITLEAVGGLLQAAASDKSRRSKAGVRQRDSLERAHRAPQLACHVGHAQRRRIVRRRVGRGKSAHRFQERVGE